MVRRFVVNGESMISVKGAVDTPIATLTELGLTDGPIVVTPTFKHMDISVDTWGSAPHGGIPPEIQAFLMDVTVQMSLVHYDPLVLDYCESCSIGAGSDGVGPGVMTRAGTLMGGNAARFAAGNNYISLNISSPVEATPWRFLTTYITGQPAVRYPLGTERSVVQLTWRAIPYTTDPYGGGFGALGVVIYDNTPDT